jgi:diaminohydroxyphosphoribosylaminopyrimidine deaminase/5-amino-6-(5-phosphoribosylamino)uracil reductase
MADDAGYMRRCLELAARYRGRTAPNPTVGCVIVRGDRVLAEGVHRGPGTAHAEADALAQLDRRRTRGATLYVNLEPCMHQGRTPPCMPLVRDAGIARLVYGSADPIRGHGGGAAALRRAGVVVDRVLVADCDAANLGFLTWGRHGRPAFTVKAGITLDGKIATVAGQSKWITSDESRRDAMLERAASDAIVVGIGTVVADRPRLDVRGLPRTAHQPLRVVLDTALRTPLDAPVLPANAPAARAAAAGCVVACGEAASPRRERGLRERGADVWRLPVDAGRVSVAALARRLGDRGVTNVLVEGGAAVHAAMLDAGLADRVLLYVAPIAVGGAAPSWVGGAGVAELADAHRFEVATVERLRGGDLRVTLTPPRRSRRGRSRAP